MAVPCQPGAGDGSVCAVLCCAVIDRRNQSID